MRRLRRGERASRARMDTLIRLCAPHRVRNSVVGLAEYGYIAVFCEGSAD